MGRGVSAEQRGRAYERYLRGKLALEAGRPEEAVALLREAARLDPEDAVLRLELARAHADRGQLTFAQEEAERALSYEPQLIAARLLLATIQLRSRNPESACKVLREAIRVAPEDRRGYVALGALLVDRGRLKEAEGLYRELARRRPRDPAAPFHLGELALAREDLAAAAAHYRHCLRLDPGHVDAYHQLLAVLLRQDRIPEAIRVATRVFRIEPTDELADVLARLHLLQGDQASARMHLDTIRESHLGETELLLRVGVSYLRAGAPVKAQQVFEDILRFDPDDHAALLHSTVALATSGWLEEAAGAQQRLPRDGPHAAAAAWLRLDLALPGRRGRRGRRAQPTVEGARKAAQELHAAGDVLCATLLLRRALRRWPEDVPLRFRLAQVLLEDQEVPEATAQLRRVLQRDPNHQGAALALGESLAERKVASEEAARLLRRVLRAHPYDPRALGALGRVLALQGRYGEAERLLDEAVRRRPDDPLQRARRADLHRRAGQLAAARADYQRALELKPGEDLRARLLQQLHALGGGGG